MSNRKFKEVPKFKNKEDEALFWDTHSTVDYFEMKPSTKDVISIRLDPDIRDTLTKVAKMEYSSISTVARKVLSEYAKSSKVRDRLESTDEYLNS